MYITRRPALAADTEFARSVHHRAYRELSERRYGPWDEKVQDEFFAAGWDAEVYEIILCDTVPCGYVFVEDSDDDITVHELVIDPEFQGRGVGTYILHEIIKRAGARQVPVRLRTAHENRAANLYRRVGFREIGRNETHILMEWNNGRPE